MNKNYSFYFRKNTMFSWMILFLSITVFGKIHNSVIANHYFNTHNLILPVIFSDNMILQRNKPIAFWGKSDPGSKVVVNLYDKTGSTTTNKNGDWSLNLPAMKAGGPYELTVSDQKGNTISHKNILVGDVWLCAGQSNMNFILASDKNGAAEIASLNNPNIREFRCTMPDGVLNPENSDHSKWIPAVGNDAKNFSAVAYYFAKKIQQTENIPIGILVMTCGNTRAESWMAEEVIQNDPALNSLNQYWNLHKNENTITFNHRPAEFYNFVVKPIIPFEVKGILWYQGESNTLPDNSGRTITERALEYKYLLSDLITSWRKDRNDEKLPFYIVQLPNYKNPSGDIQWAEIRQAQLEVSKKIPHTGLAVTIDLGSPNNLHPENKAAVAERLARWALKNEYGKSVVVSGPRIKNLKVKGNKVVLSFDFTNGGLKSKTGKNLKGFAITDAFAPNVFIPAEAYIQKNKVIVFNPSVNKPVAVKYAWADDPPVSLYNNESLPASPFMIKNH